MAELSYHISDYGRKKRMLAIPESHTLHLCPNACARRQGIRALRNGVDDAISYLRLSEEDIISGDYEECAIRAVADLLGLLPKKPRVISLFVNCIDDFLGTDNEALLERMQMRYPDIRFLLSHINPIAASDGKSPSGLIHMKLYEPLEKTGKRDNGITVVGAFEPLPESSEIHTITRKLGWSELRQLCSCVTYEQYLRLADSSLLLGVSHLGNIVSKELSQRLDVPKMSWSASYSIKEIAQHYEALAALSGAKAEAFSLVEHYQKEAEAEVALTLKVIGDIPLSVDTAASMQPFSMALHLLEYGFKVSTVFGLHVKSIEHEAREKLRKSYPQVKIIEKESHEALLGYDHPIECIAIGRDAAFLLKAEHFVDMYHDEGYFGYQGVVRLMRDIRCAKKLHTRWDDSYLAVSKEAKTNVASEKTQDAQKTSASHEGDR